VKPARFDYARPSSLAEASRLLSDQAVFAKILAGGQSLGPMLNLRLVQPQLLVDITGIPELRRVEESDDALILGACVTHANIEDGRVPDATRGILPAIAGGIAYRAVRNRGTIGGSLAHADPAADWVSTLAALGAEVILADASTRRRLPVAQFMTGVFETALKPGEILEAVRIPRPSAAARWGYIKLCRKPGEFAHAMGVVFADPARDLCRAVVGAIEARPIVLDDARPLFGNGNGRPVGEVDPAIAARLLEEKGMTDPIDRQIRIAALKRAAARANGA